MAGPLKSFMYFFTLKQGTVLIAIVQMFISAYILIFYLLGLSHASEIKEMIDRDSVDILGREVLEDVTSRLINSHRMELARHNANEEVYLMYCGLGITAIHFITSLMLYYGVLTNNRHFLAPWMIVMTTIIAALIVMLFCEYKITANCPFLAMISKKSYIIDRLFLLILMNICFYTLLTVYSTHNSLQQMQDAKHGVIHQLHDVQVKYLQQQTTKNSLKNKKMKKKVSFPNPYNV